MRSFTSYSSNATEMSTGALWRRHWYHIVKCFLCSNSSQKPSENTLQHFLEWLNTTWKTCFSREITRKGISLVQNSPLVPWMDVRWRIKTRDLKVALLKPLPASSPAWLQPQVSPGGESSSTARRHRFKRGARWTTSASIYQEGGVERTPSVCLSQTGFRQHFKNSRSCLVSVD